MDIEAYRNRKKKTVAELAQMLGVKEAAVYNYKYGKSKPSYESIEKMLLDGAFLSEIFSDSVQNEVVKSLKESEELGTKLVQNSSVTPPAELANDPAFQKGLQQSIDAKVSAAVKAELAALKSKGLL